MIITLSGPAASGKGTLAKMLVVLKVNDEKKIWEIIRKVSPS